MKKFFLSLCLVVPTWAMATVPSELADMACRSQIEAVLTKFGSKDKWFRTIDPQVDVKAFRSPTSEIGKWVEIQTYPNPYVFLYEAEQTQVRQYDVKNCNLLNRSTVEGLGFSAKKKNTFLDSDIQKLAQSEKPSMLYVWSPLMSYSITEVATFQKVAKELGMDFIPVVHSHQSLKEVKELLAGHELGKKVKFVNSLEVYMREGLVHYPSTYIVGNGNISNRIFGVMTEDVLKQAIAQELALMSVGSR